MASMCAIPECSRPCYQRNGIVHDFCGRTHAREALNRGMLYDLQPPHGKCHRCRLRGCTAEVYYDEDTETVHDFCSRRHADLAMARGEWPLPGSRGYRQCALDGCNEGVYLNPETNQESDYCSRSHANQDQEEEEKEEEEEEVAGPTKCSNLQCYRESWTDETSGANMYFCGSNCASGSGYGYLVGQGECSLPGCVRATMLHYNTRHDLGYCSGDHCQRATDRSLEPNTEPYVDRTFRGGPSPNDFKLMVLTNQHSAYASLKEQFFSKWEKPDCGLRVDRIFKVQVPADVHAKHSEYARGMGNMRRRFHGTKCSPRCNFFLNLRGGPCGAPDCAVCNICRHGFQMQGCLGRTAQLTNFKLRYGEGLYFSSVSGKANDYAIDSEKPHLGRRWRCMFMASVTVGRAYCTDEGELPNHLCPPPGYDSVVGEVGKCLNYDEVAVYDEDAALPTFLIVYSMGA